MIHAPAAVKGEVFASNISDNDAAFPHKDDTPWFQFSVFIDLE